MLQSSTFSSTTENSTSKLEISFWGDNPGPLTDVASALLKREQFEPRRLSDGKVSLLLWGSGPAESNCTSHDNVKNVNLKDGVIVGPLCLLLPVRK